MLMRTNKDQDRINHFSIRKLSIGAASVLLSTTLYFGLNIQGSTQVHAAETNSATQVQNKNVVDATNDAKDDATQRINSVDKETPVENTNDQVTNSSTLSDKTVQQVNTLTSSSNKEQTTESVNDVKGSTQDNIATIETKVPSQTVNKPQVLAVQPQSTTASKSEASASVEYPYGDNNVVQGDWFKIHVASGTLTNVKRGDKYTVTIGKDMPLNYNTTSFTTPDFDVVYSGPGTFDLTAKGDYQKANFDINASMSYNKPLTSAGIVNIPVTISHENDILNSMTVPVMVTPAQQQPEKETHPVLYYRCYGNIPGTDKIAWGVYINYTKQPLQDLNVTATFGGNQKLLTKTINVYLPEDVTQGINQTSYPDNTYSYDLSKNIQGTSNETEFHVDDGSIAGYSDQPIYIYFQTEVPSYDGKDPDQYTSNIDLSAKGIKVPPITTKPGEGSNSGNSDGSNQLKDVNQTQKVTETINYLEQGTNKVLAPAYTADTSFTRNGKLNTVTNETTWENWNPESYNFKAVTSPVIKGYTTDTKIVTVQKVDANSKDIVINVYYTKNANIPVNETKTVNETIEYLYKDTNKQAAPTYTAQPLTFTRTGEKDPVTDQITWNNWTPAQDFKAVTSPVLKGYTADKLEIGKQTVDHTSDDLHFVVYYTKDANIPVNETKTVNETIEYLYKDTNKQAAPTYTAQPLIFTRTGEKDPVTDQIIWNNWTPAQDFKAVTSPVLKGYTADKLEIGKQTVDHASDDLHFVVYYTKKEQTTGPSLVEDDDVITETIKYVYADTGEQAAPTYKDAVGFTREGTNDGKTTTWNAWNPKDATFKAVTSPEIDGYTVSEKVVKAITVKPGDKNIEKIVYYTKKEQTAGPSLVEDDDVITETIKYVYADTGEQAAPTYKDAVGFTREGTNDGKTTTWNAWNPKDATFKTVTSPEIDGYTVSEKVVKAITVKPGDKNIEKIVYYTKKEQTAGPSLVEDDDVITETINYVYANGPKKGEQAAPTYKNAVGFTREGTNDGKTTTWQAWNPENGTFKEVTSPEIAGYTASKKTVNEATVKPGDKNIEVTVYYTENEQTTGPSLVEDDDVITETIKYVYADTGEQAAPTYKDAVGFTREGTNDGKTTTWNAWNPKDATFKEVTSPEIDGYTVSEKVVKAITVKPGDKNIEIIIYYTPISVPRIPIPTPEPTPEEPDVPQPHPAPTPEEPEVPQPHDAVPSEPTPVKPLKPTENMPDIPQPHATVVSHVVEEKQQTKKNVEIPVKNEKKQTLPQTGSQKNDLAIIGLGMSAIGALLSLFGSKKKEN